MSVIANLLVKIGADSSNLQKELNAAQSKVNMATNAFAKAGTVLTVGLTAPILAAGAASFKLASDINESMNKVEVAFQSSSNEIKRWSENTLTSIGLAQGTALDMAASFGDMATSMGKTTQEAANMAMGIVNLAGDLASFKNISISEVNTSLAGIFTGETESLKRLGIVMTEANLQAYALSQGIKTNVSEMEQAEKIQLRYDYVLSVTTNSQGDFTRTQQSAANQTRILQESIKELGASLGTALLPTITSAISKINEMVQKFTQMSDEQKKSTITVALMVAAIGPMLSIVAGLIKTVAAYNAIMVTYKTTVVAATVATTGLNASLLASPWGLVVIAVGTLIAAIAAIAIETKNTTEAIERMNELSIAENAKAGAAERAEIEATYSALTASIENKSAAEESYYMTVSELAQKTYDEQLALGDTLLQQMKDELEERRSATTEAYNASIDAIRAEYGVYEEAEKTKTELAQEAADSRIELLSNIASYAETMAAAEGDAYITVYNNLMAAATELHDEKMMQYAEEYAAQIGVINSVMSETTSFYQSQIDEINALTEAENAAAKEKSDAQKITDLEDKLSHSYTLADKAKATEALNEELAKQERERILAQRTEAIDSLKTQMEEAVRIAKEEKEKVTSEFNSRIEAEKTATTSSADFQIAEYQRIRLAKEAEETAKYEAMIDELDAEDEALNKWIDETYKPALDLKLAADLATEKTRHETIMNDLAIEAAALIPDKEKGIAESETNEKIANALSIIENLQKEMDAIKNGDTMASTMFGQMFKPMVDEKAIKEIQSLIDQQVAIIQSLRGTASGYLGNDIEAYANGTNYVPETGLAYLHKGEAVIPADQNSGSGITIYATYNVTDKATAEYANSNLVSVLQARGLVGGFR